MFHLHPTRKPDNSELPYDFADSGDQEMNDHVEPGFKLRADSMKSGDSDQLGSEEQDKMCIDYQSVSQVCHSEMAFRQLDYLWLFDPYLNFKQRTNFRLDDALLTLEDYEQMHGLNRTLLTYFLTILQETSLVHACNDFTDISEIDEFLVEQKWADECIDEELR